MGGLKRRLGRLTSIGCLRAITAQMRGAIVLERNFEFFLVNKNT